MKLSLVDFLSEENNIQVTLVNKIFKQPKDPIEIAYFILHPSEETIEHDHASKELFICMTGSVTIIVDKTEIYTMKEKEAVFLNQYRSHHLINQSHAVAEMLSIAWMPSVRIP